MLAPKAKLSASEWAEEKRIVGQNSAEPGRWKNNRTPYLKEPMDCASDTITSDVTCMFSFQIGKTASMVENTIGFYIDHLPTSILAVLETDKKAAELSARLSGMFNITPCLKDKIIAKSRDSHNTIDHKDFPGGTLDIVSAGSEADLSSRVIQVVIQDECDKYAATKAGDPSLLADNRAITYRHRAKRIKISTPRDFGQSRVERAFLRSDRRFYHVPCPHCGVFQAFGHVVMSGMQEKIKLKFEQLKFTRKEGDPLDVDDCWYECEVCKGQIRDKHKFVMLLKGKWVAEKPFKGHAGFWFSCLFSPWIDFAQFVREFLRTKDDKEQFKTCINEWFAETWEEKIEKMEVEPFLARRENYIVVPDKGVILICTIDVQDDRLEAIVRAYGPGKESWGIDHSIFYGNPEASKVWESLDEYLSRSWQHEVGIFLPLTLAFIDASYLFKRVCEFTKPRFHRNIFAYRGSSDLRHELVAKKPTRKNALRAPVIYGGPNEGKSVLFSRLAVQETGPLYMHWNQAFDEEYFKQMLQSERPSWEKGVKVWKKVSASARNEALDLEYMNICAFDYYCSKLKKLNLEEMARNMKPKSEEKITQEQPKEENEVVEQPVVRNKRREYKIRGRRNKGWVNNWR